MRCQWRLIPWPDCAGLPAYGICLALLPACPVLQKQPATLSAALVLQQAWHNTCRDSSSLLMPKATFYCWYTGATSIPSICLLRCTGHSCRNRQLECRDKPSAANST